MACLIRSSLEEICSTPDMLLYCSESFSSVPKEVSKTLTCSGERDELTTSQVFPIESGFPVTPKAKRVCSGSQPSARLPSYFPPTPDATPQRGVKRSAPLAEFDATSPRRSKRTALSDAPTSPTPSTPVFDRILKLGKVVRGELVPDSPWRHTDNLECTYVRGFRYTWLPKLSADELKRASEAVLRQIDWMEVAEYVASNRGPEAYRRAIKAVLQNKVDDIVDVEDFYECFEKRMEELKNS